LLKKGPAYYPVYVIEPERFFKSEAIERKVYNYTDGAILKIGNMISYSLEKEEKTLKYIDLSVIQDFVKVSDYVFKVQFLNSQNLVYGVILEHKRNKNHVCVPVQYSYHSMIDIPVKNLFLRSNFKLRWDALDQFVKSFNKFVFKESEDKEMYTLEYNEASSAERKRMKLEDRVIPLYPIIKYNSFITHRMAYYWNIGQPDKKTKSKASNVQNLLYDPDRVNKIIVDSSDAVSDKRMKMLGKSLYENYIYQIVVMEFMKEFSRQKNKKIRSQLIDMIKKTNFKASLTAFIKKFNILLSEYPDDAQRIKAQINEFYNVHLDQFDRLNLKEGPQLRKQFKKLSEKFVKVGQPKYGTFPNIMVPCSDSDASYCVSNKLVIPSNKLNEIIDIFADIVQNEYMERYLSYVTFINNTLDPFKFEKRLHEDISVQIL